MAAQPQSQPQANAPFKPHMSLQEASELKLQDAVDFRVSTGQWMVCTVTQKVASNLQLFSAGWHVWCDYSTQLNRFAKSESISKRAAHRFKDFKVGDYIDINPLQRHPGWKPAEIKQIDQNSGQIQVMYEHENKNYIHWAHLDDINEVALVTTKSVHNASGASQLATADDQMLNMALQMSMDAANNVNADDVDAGLQAVLQQSVNPSEQTIDDELRQALAMSMHQQEPNPAPQIQVIPDPVQPSQNDSGSGLMQQILSNLQQNSNNNSKSVSEANVADNTEVLTMKSEIVSLKSQLDVMKNENISQKQVIESLRNRVSILEDERKEFEMKINELKEENQRLRLENLKEDKYEEWSVDEVVYWIMSLDSNMYSQYEDKLKKVLNEEGINGECLELVGKDDIKRWGITNFKHFTILYQHIRALVESTSSSAAIVANVARANNSLNEGSNAPTAYI